MLNPTTTALHKVAPDLELFDTQGSLQRESALVSQVLEVLRDLEDEGEEPSGAILLDAKARKGFQGFSRPPFGWPDELVRLVLAACFRAGAIHLERQTGTGPSALYDYSGADEIFAKITTFRKLSFHTAETSLTVEQIKQASKALIVLGVSGTPESGNAIASAVRELGGHLKAGLDEAKIRCQQGLPLPDEMLNAEDALAEPTTAKDPTAAVIAFLTVEKQWKAVHEGLAVLHTFLDANRHHDYEASRRLVELSQHHPPPDTHPRAAVLAQALRDIEAIKKREGGDLSLGRLPDGL